jgi:hypothetical protein
MMIIIAVRHCHVRPRSHCITRPSTFETVTVTVTFNCLVLIPSNG